MTKEHFLSEQQCLLLLAVLLYVEPDKLNVKRSVVIFTLPRYWSVQQNATEIVMTDEDTQLQHAEIYSIYFLLHALLRILLKEVF